MDVHAQLDAPCAPAELFAHVDDLAAYPAWNDLVARCETLGGDPPAWRIDLRASVGPLARSKRLRMVRTEHDPQGHRVTFERSEEDGRRHSPWVLRAAVDEAAGGCTLSVHLHYGGALWTGGVLERVLADQIRSGRQRLLDLVQPTR